MIYTKAEWTLAEGVCDGGRERTMVALEKLGLTEKSMVPMSLILRELGLSDTLYSFCRVRKQDKREADQVVGKYTVALAGIALNWLNIADNTYGPKMVEANKAINKRAQGVKRPELLAARYAGVKAMYDAETRPHLRHWLNVYLCLLSTHADHLAVTHGSIALMDGADVVGVREATHAMLVRTLSDLLGPDDGNDVQR